MVNIVTSCALAVLPFVAVLMSFGQEPSLPARLAASVSVAGQVACKADDWEFFELIDLNIEIRNVSSTAIAFMAYPPRELVSRIEVAKSLTELEAGTLLWNDAGSFHVFDREWTSEALAPNESYRTATSISIPVKIGPGGLGLPGPGRYFVRVSVVVRGVAPRDDYSTVSAGAVEINIPRDQRVLDPPCKTSG